MRAFDAPRDAEAIVFDRLLDEFCDAVDVAYLRDVARQEVGDLGSARIRDFIPILAWRQARERVVRHIHATGVVELDARRPAHLE